VELFWGETQNITSSILNQLHLNLHTITQEY